MMLPPLFLVAKEIAQRAKCIATPIGDDGKGDTFYCYDGGVFKPCGFPVAFDKAFELLGDGISLKDIDAALKLLPVAAAVRSEEVNKNARELINVRNGMLNWRTGELLSHDPQYLSINQIPVAWDPNAKSEMLDEFLNAVLPPDALKTVEEFIGYLLIPDTSLAKCLVLVGDVENGKHTFLMLVEALLGKGNIGFFPLHALVEERLAVGELFGMLANVYDGGEPRDLKDTGLFKRIVTGDLIKVERRYRAPIAFRPYARLVFATDQRPRGAYRSPAFLDHQILVVFKNRLLNYAKVLADPPVVLPALLVRAVNGLRRLMERGRFELPKSSYEALGEDSREYNSGHDFVSEFCEYDSDGEISKSELYRRYQTWCKVECRRALSAREFNRTVQQAMGAKEVRRDNVRFWAGVRWKKNGEPPRAGIDGEVSVAAS
jgi:putative DNA primase/helicase